MARTPITAPGLFQHPKVRQIVQRLKAQDTSNYIERNEKGTWLAFSRFDEVSILISATHTRNPWTNAWGVKLKPLQVVELYNRESDNYIYGQRFKLIMACVAPVDDTYVGNIVQEVWNRHVLFRGGWLKWLHQHKMEAQRQLHEAAYHFWGEADATFRPYALHVGKAIEGETFGKGRILERLELHVERREGGVSVPVIRRGSVPIPVQDS